ncbi:prolyl-tRNA synthetase associated domain-containing protein [Pelosinus baikalensis]|uniref:Prolyl-tRNA synthetase associated domain-containing protein n=1 Tax=Pelosinus baikalensis TaxID=2892015 RepID=A0ABS8HUS8_9FIRM|nr:prolyl-tRNA synthetase associated domain-containing protein [Pelosinus baikalensis]MCC5466911.1 prolyl-tRNA synthetase associated domain-containing protein [Pelosinus baikalensis]
MENQQKVFEKLDELKIKYEVMNHPAVYTIEEMDELGIANLDDVCKNLFLRDYKGKRHFIVVLDKDKQADLKKMREQLGTTALSFASEERLQKYLQLSKGAVTPFGIINDTNCAVEVVFDKDLIDKKSLGFHPNENTATVWVSFDDIKEVIQQNGNKIAYVTM